MGATDSTMTNAAQKLREERHLRPISREEEGLPVREVAAGVYGFTYSPAFDATPLFSNAAYRTFEFHKLADGSVELVGYVTTEDQHRLAAAHEGLISVYPGPWQTADRPISIALDRLVRSSRTPLRDEGCPYRIELR